MKVLHTIGRLFSFASIALLLLLLSVNVWRAATQSITHDEALTYQVFVSGSWNHLFNSYDANHHVLHTILCKVFVGLFGLSEFSLRLASLLGGALYFWVVYRLSSELFDRSWLLLLSTATLSLNPYLLDYLSVARGYGMALAFFLLGLYYLARSALGRGQEDKWVLLKAGTSLGLSVSANLTLLVPSMALAGAFLASLFLENRAGRAPVSKPQPHGSAARKGKKKTREDSVPGTRRLAGVAWRLLLPFLVVMWIILTSPLSQASKSQFYFGADTLWKGFQSLVTAAFFQAPHGRGILHHRPLTVNVGYALAILALAAAIVLAVRAALRWGRAAALEKFLFLAASTALGSILIVVVAHAALGVLYPEGRTGLYWIPLFVLNYLAVVGLAAGKRWFQAILVAPVLIAVAQFIAQFHVTYYADWMYGARSKEMVHTIIARHASAPRPSVIIEGSWQFEPAVNFYRELYRLDWLKPMERGEPLPGADYYIFLPQDVRFVDALRLTPLYRDDLEGSVLAAPR